jgi:hypothetical protein
MLGFLRFYSSGLLTFLIFLYNQPFTFSYYITNVPLGKEQVFLPILGVSLSSPILYSDMLRIGVKYIGLKSN